MEDHKPESSVTPSATNAALQQNAETGPRQDDQEDIKTLLGPLEEPRVRNLLSIISRTTNGPDPETAKILVEATKHEETCRLEAYKASLDLRDTQNDREHQFRKLRLNREFAITAGVMLFAIVFSGIGVFLLTTSQNTTLGSNLLIGGLALILYLLKGNTDFLSKN